MQMGFKKKLLTLLKQVVLHGPPLGLARSYGWFEWPSAALTWGFACAGGWLSWLLQRERDGGADEVEGLALFAGGLGEHRDGGGDAGEPDLVAGQGGQVAEQAAEDCPFWRAARWRCLRRLLAGGDVESAAEPERDPMREDRMPGDQVLSPVTAGGPTSA